jgi:hypothetical protein
MGRTITCEIRTQTIEITSGRVGLSLSLAEISPEIWAWNPATDEKPAPPLASSTASTTVLETPQSVVATVTAVVINAVTAGARIKVTWDQPDRLGLGARIEWRRQISPGVFDIWETGSANADDLAFVSSAVDNDGSVYEVRMQFVSTGGVGGPYSATTTVSAIADPVGPDPATISSATGGAGSITVSYTLPNSANCVGARLWRANSNTLTGAVLFGTTYGSPGQSFTSVVTGYAVGTRWVIVEAINGSGVGGTIAGQSATVT